MRQYLNNKAGHGGKEIRRTDSQRMARGWPEGGTTSHLSSIRSPEVCLDLVTEAPSNAGRGCPWDLFEGMRNDRDGRVRNRRDREHTQLLATGNARTIGKLESAGILLDRFPRYLGRSPTSPLEDPPVRHDEWGRFHFQLPIPSDGIFGSPRDRLFWVRLGQSIMGVSLSTPCASKGQHDGSTWNGQHGGTRSPFKNFRRDPDATDPRSIGFESN